MHISLQLENAEIGTKNIKYALINYKTFSSWITTENDDIYLFHLKTVKIIHILLNYKINFLNKFKYMKST